MKPRANLEIHLREVNVADPEECLPQKTSDNVQELLDIFSACAGWDVTWNIIREMLPWLSYDKPVGNEGFLARAEWVYSEALVFWSQLLKQLGRPMKLMYFSELKYCADVPTYSVPAWDLDAGIIPVCEQNLSSKRAELIKELVLSEETYLMDMQLFHTMIISDFFKKKYKLLLMSNLGDIIKLHEAMFEELRLTDNIARVFLSRGEALKIYVHYVENYIENQMRMRKLQLSGNSKSRIVLEEFNQFACRPVSRFPRYGSIFKKLQKHTELCHPSRSDVDHLVKLISSILDLTSSAVRKWQMKTRAIELNEEIGRKRLKRVGITSLLQPARSLVKEGTVLVYPSKASKVFVEVNCLLFNDVILLVHRSKRRLQSMFLEGACVRFENHKTIFGILVFGLAIRISTSDGLVFFLQDEKKIRGWEDSIKRLIPLQIN